MSLIAKFDGNMNVGDVGVWKGYTSTSYSSTGTTNVGGGDWDIEILALKGVKGINANAKATYYNDLYKEEVTDSLANHPNEKELLLGRNTKYVVLSKDVKNHTCRVVGFWLMKKFSRNMRRNCVNMGIIYLTLFVVY